VILDIILESPYLEKPRNPILNKLNVEWLTWKKISITQKDPNQKMTIKQIRIKIEKKN
jgi:hypothetical protein